MSGPEIIEGIGDARYDPVVPDIAPSSICEEIFVRAYSEPQLPRRKGSPDLRKPRTHPETWFDGEFLVIDTETVEHRLTFGAYERYKRGGCIERAVFCADDLPSTQPDNFGNLQAICEKLGVRLYLLANVFTSHIWRMRRNGGTLTFFNASYDLSRLATSWKPAVATARRNARFVNGFEFIRSFETWKDRHGKPLVGPDGILQSRIVEQPFVRIRRDDRHHVRYDMGRANVLDLATLTHTLTDQTYTLPLACGAFGIELAERPGEHDGAITEENVAGCLYDVAKTGELLFATGREYDRHRSISPRGTRNRVRASQKPTFALLVSHRARSCSRMSPRSIRGLRPRPISVGGSKRALSASPCRARTSMPLACIQPRSSF